QYIRSPNRIRMQKSNRYLPFVILILLPLCSFIYKFDDVVNYYGIPESLSFNNIDYKLAWSSHPNDTYYKQEYVPAGDAVEHFHDMVMIDFIQTDLPLKKAVSAQINTIEDRKKTDKVCNYQLLKQNDEYILDFLMSEGTTTVNTIEWSVYHYSAYTDKAGHKGILMFGVSHCAYDDDVMPFLRSLGNYRNAKLKALTVFPIPEIQIK
ncbi:MAG: hypothetical protein ACHQF4_08365, partial [Sphingobacteriales bacterium]